MPCGATSRGRVSMADDDASVWAEVVGQDRAVDALRRAAAAPVHAYLFIGPPGSTKDEAAQAFERYDLISAPVVNIHRQVVGWLSVDKVVDRLSEDSFKQSLGQVGLGDDVDLFGPVWLSGRKRWIWLGLNLFTAFVASRVIGVFEGSIERLAALAALMPIVASIGGNTGNQTVALVIRGIALSQLNESNRIYLLRKEVAISVLNGLMWGFLMGVVTLLLYGSLPLAGVMDQRAQHGLLDPVDVLLDEVAGALEVQQRVGDHLARAVVGDLSAAVGRHHGNIAGREHMLRLAGQAQREHRRVLAQPQLVGRVLRARGGEVLHGLVGRQVVGPAALAPLHFRGQP